MSKEEFFVVAFDVGGSHVSAAVVTSRECVLQGKASRDLYPGASKTEILDTFADLARECIHKAGADLTDLGGIGFAFPGPFDYAQGISHMQHKHESLFEVNVRREVACRLSIPASAVVFINDAAAFVLGEIHGGAAKDADRVIGLTLGTGIGSGFAISRTIVTSGSGVPEGGEVWNLPWLGGIMEDRISTRAIQAIYKGLSGKDSTVKEIASRAALDPLSRQTFEKFADDLAEILEYLSRSFHPELIVLGGAIARSSNLFVPQLEERINPLGVRIEISRLFDDAALVGAAAAWVAADTDRSKN